MGSTMGFGPTDDLTRTRAENSCAECYQSASAVLTCCYNSFPSLASARDPGMESKFTPSEEMPLCPGFCAFVCV